MILSQEGGLNYFKSNYAFPNTTVPEKASLLRFSEFPNIEAAGGTNINIPIYTIKMDGLEIPVSLTYNTKGNKVSDIASNIGLGWSLVGDGSVECQVNDLNDFDLNTTLYDDIQFEPTPIPYRTLNGYLIPSNNPQLGVDTSWRKDFSPDFYIINAPGLRNKFYLEKDLSVCPYDNCNYLTNRFKPVFFEEQFIKSEFVKRENYNTGIGGEYDHERNANIKKFSFTSNKGFTYKFIDPTGILTKNYSIGALNGWLPDGISFNDSNWKLSEIISPNSNNVINYQYESFTNNYLHPQLIRNDSHYTDDFNMGGLVRGFSNNRYYNTRSVTLYGNTKRLKKILSNDVEIIFSYDENRIDYAGGRLKAITVANKFSGVIINTFTFHHSYFISNETCDDPYDCYRLRLDRITDSKSGDYIFTYDNGNSDYKFPRRSSSKIDYAGYFNGNNSDLRMFSDAIAGSVAPNASYYPHGKFYYYAHLTEDNYLPFKLHNQTVTNVYGDIDLSSNMSSLIGLLTNVKYPTGGEMKLAYENDQFNYLDSDYILGSARVKSMELLDNNLLTKKVNYEYKLDNGKSSGLIAGFIPPSDNGSHALVVGLELSNSSTVLYSKVVENVESKGRIEYYYSNFDKFPNKHGKLITCTPNNGWCTNYSNGYKQAKELKYPYMNIYKPDFRRGVLERKIFFNNNNDKIKENSYEYEFIKKDSLLLESGFSAGPPSSDPIRNSSLNFSGGRINYIYTYTNKIKNDSNKEYFNNSLISTENEYYYNPNHHELITLSTKLPDQSIMETHYQYAFEKNNQKLLNANIIATPLETTIVKKKSLNDTTGKITSKIETKYDGPTTLLPTSTLSYEPQNPTVGTTEITYNQYDFKGNLLQYTVKNGVPVSIIWGYNQTQPIAKIEGAKLQDIPQNLIDSIVNTSNSDAQTGSEASESALISALDSFRTHSALSGYQITTYSYDPLIGVRSITPPSGIREVYLYDSANRLEKVVDANGKVLKEYQYHYKN
jgi:hypothetical protein